MGRGGQGDHHTRHELGTCCATAVRARRGRFAAVCTQTTQRRGGYLWHDVVPCPVRPEILGYRLQHMDGRLTNTVHRVLRQGASGQELLNSWTRTGTLLGWVQATSKGMLPNPDAPRNQSLAMPCLQPQHALLAKLLLEQVRPQLQVREACYLIASAFQ